MGKGFEDAIIEYLNHISGSIDGLTTTSDQVQQEIARMLKENVLKFEINDGRFVNSQDLRRRMLEIDGKFEKLLSGKLYTNAIRDYLASYSTIEDTTIALHKDYNDLQVDVSKISPARKVAFEQAKNALYDSGIRAQYKDPVNHMLMVQVTTGGSISDMEQLLGRWTTGDLSAPSKSPTGKPIPNLKQYTHQLASDASYHFAGTVQNIIQDEYGLDGITYVGDIIRDSRPFCVHLVNLKRDIGLGELKELLARPDLKAGRIPGTTVKNFCTYRGGYVCRHMAFPIRLKDDGNKTPPKKEAKAAFTPAGSITEANAFAEKHLADKANFKGLPVDLVNEVNKTAYEMFSKYPELRTNSKFIGTIQERNTLIKQAFIDDYMNTVGAMFKRSGFSDDEIKRRAQKEANSYVGSTPAGVVAQSAYASKFSVGNGISFNRNGITTLEEFNNSSKRMEESGWWSKGAGSISHTVVHELGHEMDKLVGFVDDEDFRDLYKRHYAKGKGYITENLSGYAWAGKNPKKEMIAEAWAEYNVSEDPREIAVELAELLIKKYNEKFNK